MAEEATEQAPVEKPVATAEMSEEGSAAKYTQADMDSIAEKVRKSTEAALLKRLEQEKAEAEMTELEKLRKKSAEEATNRELAESRASILERTVDVMKRIRPDNYAPARYVDDVIRDWNGEEFDPDAALQKAHELFLQEAGAAGLATDSRPAPKRGTNYGGTPDPATSRSEFDGKTKQQVIEEAKGMAPRKGAEHLKKYQAWITGGGTPLA